MSRSKIILLATFFMVLSAGMVLGRLWATLPAMTVSPPAATQPSPHGSARQPWWAAQLNLTTQQRQQMDAIWTDVKPKVDNNFERRHQLELQREKDVVDLLGPQYAAYEKIYTEFYNQRKSIDDERQKLIQDAEAQTKALLSDSQLKELEALGPHEGHGPRGSGGQGRHSLTTSTTMPAVDGGDGIRPQ